MDSQRNKRRDAGHWADLCRGPRAWSSGSGGANMIAFPAMQQLPAQSAGAGFKIVNRYLNAKHRLYMKDGFDFVHLSIKPSTYLSFCLST